jgi:uncharacterized membrane protein HdeD (DUF308 family)
MHSPELVFKFIRGVNTMSIPDVLLLKRSQWFWFLVFGGALILAGALGSLNLLATNIFSVVFIAWMMVIGGGLQITHAFVTPGLGRKALLIISGIFYVISGFFAMIDPLLASLGLSLALGVTLIMSGMLRAASGMHGRSSTGWPFMFLTGLMTIFTGGFIVATWPHNSLWILGLFLVVDLMFQGLGVVSYGLAIRFGPKKVGRAAQGPRPSAK